jgi:hypothetical protein
LDLRSWSEQSGFPAGCGKCGAGDCGGIGLLRKGKRDSTQSRSRKCRSAGYSW